MSNSNQENIESRLATYIDGELDDKDRLEIEQHLQQHPQYRRVIDDLRKQRDWLHGLPREAAPAELSEAFTSQLERSVLLDARADSDAPRGMRIRPMPRFLAAAAIVLLTVGLATIVYFVLPDRNAHTVSLAPSGARPISRPASAATEMSPYEEKSTEGSVDNRRADAAPTAPSQDAVAAAPIHRAGNEAFAIAAKPGAAIEEKSAEKSLLREQPAANGAGQKAIETGAIVSEPRDVELDQLARDVSQDAHVKELLAGNSASKAQANAQNPARDNAVVLVVRSNDPRQVQNELAKFFSHGNIDWQPAPKPLELALNTSLSRQNDETLASNGTANRREIDLKAVESERLRDEPARITAPVDADPDRAVALTPAQGQQGQGQVVNHSAAGLKPNSIGASALKVAAAEAHVMAKASPPAPAMANAAAAPQSLPNVDRGNVDEHSAGKMLKDGKELKQAWGSNAAPVDNLYVARGLSRRQAQELNAYLARSGEVREANQSRPLGEYQYVGDALAKANLAPASNAAGDALLPTPSAAPTLAPGGVANAYRKGGDAARLEQGIAGDRQKQLAAAPGQAKDEVEKRDGLGRGAAGGGESVVQKGDSLRLRYPYADKKSPETSETVKVNEDGSIAARGRPVQVVGKTVAEVQRALQQQSQLGQGNGAAATTQPAVSVERIAAAAPGAGQGGGGGALFGSAGSPGHDNPAADVTKEIQRENRARADSPAPAAPVSAPSTQPAALADADDAEGTVDVVIVIHREAGALGVISAPSGSTAQAVAAPPAIVTPATQPAPPAAAVRPAQAK